MAAKRLTSEQKTTRTMFEVLTISHTTSQTRWESDQNQQIYRSFTLLPYCTFATIFQDGRQTLVEKIIRTFEVFLLAVQQSLKMRIEPVTTEISQLYLSLYRSSQLVISGFLFM